MLDRSGRIRFAVSLTLLAGTAHAQVFCNGDGTVCTFGPGSDSNSLKYLYPGSSPFQFTNSAELAVASPASDYIGSYILWVGGVGPNAASSASANAAPGGSGALTTVINTGSVSQLAFIDSPSWTYALLAESWGGNGGASTDSKYNGGAGAAGLGINVTNSAPIDFGGVGSIGYGASALEVHGIGGSGGNVSNDGLDGNGNPKYNGGQGGPGGAGQAVSLSNTGAITAGLGDSPSFYVQGNSGFRGLAAFSMGGNAGAGSAGAGGGSAGPVGVTNSAPVQIWWTWNGPPPADPFASKYPTRPPLGVYGLLASSSSGNGQMSVTSRVNGGSGSGSGTIDVTVNPGGDVTIVTSGSANAPGAGIGAFSTGGTGGAGYDKSVGGLGGSVPSTSTTPAIAVNVTGAGIDVSGEQMSGIVAMAEGGTGGSGGKGQDNSDGADGGSVGSHTTQGVDVTLSDATVSTAGTSGAGIVAAVTGGVAGNGTDYENELATGATGQACRSTSGFARSGCGGGGGNTSAVNVSLSGTSGVSTTGAASPGIVAVTQGGAGGTGGTLTAIEGTVGSGGSGGQGAPVTVTLNSGASVTTTGGIGAQPDAASYGIFAASRGGTGGTGGEAAHGIVSNSGDGGPGGGGYDVTVSVASGAGVATSGQNAAAIVAQSLSGSGGAGGEVFGGVVGNAGSGGAGGNTGNVEVDNSGTLRTVGDGAQGVLAQTMSGTGGAGGTGNGIFYASGGTGGTAGTVNGATVRNAGTIATAGSAAHGILAQAIGGGGGDAGKSTGDVATVGGSGALAADGGFAVFTQTGGAVTTTGPAAIAVLAQAIGGGGGDGGNASGVIGTVGASAGGGGAGGVALAQVTGGTLATSGAQAHGLVLQSIGGGGGNAGNATSASSAVAVTIGGSGGSGGAGNTVEASFTGGMTLQGTGAAGLVAQSIGGGGGSGGSAYAVSGGIVVDESMALGGTGGGGGAGGPVTVALSGATIQTGQFAQPTTPTNLLPVDAYGVVAQSIGGGGGLGGSSSASAVAVGIPLPSELDDYSYALSQSVGGSGGSGGAGGTVQAGMANGSSITTQGQGSHGLIAQSIGGGGGTAGDSSALAATLSYGRAATASTSNSFSADVAFAAGGGGGGGGNAGQVSVWIGGGPGGAQGKGTITTYGDYANGVVAHSIGGGGGNAGYGSTTTVDFGATRNLKIGVGVGGFGGVGGDGCTTTSSGACTTTAVTVYKQGSITTFGASAMGIVAQSVGGGGGTSQGGTIDLGAAYTAGDGKTVTPSATLTGQWGGTGAAAGKGGPVSVSVQGAVRTHGGDATAVLAQSIGGGGGVGGSAGAEASADNPVSTLTGVREFISEVVETNLNWSAVSATVSLGGTGGAGGAGGEVDVTHSGQIATKGDWAQGIVAQSIGGGGGKGGTAVSDSSGSTLSLAFSVGGSGGAGGSGGVANVTLSGGTIATGTPEGNPFPGFGAFGVLAQSVGGGGGVGVDASANATGTLRLGGGWGGGGGGGGDGGEVTVSTSGAGSLVTTQAEQAHAVVLQSIGGGGGVAGSGNASVTSGLFKPLMDVGVGGTDGYSGSGGSVSFDTNAAPLGISTRGINAFGILAQSIGGGGGLAMTSANIATSVSRLGGDGTTSGNGGAVSVQLGTGSSIDTTGFGAHGIVAQSIGGGGGIAALPAPTASPSTTFSHVSSASSGGTGNLTVGVAGSIWTHGPGAHGVVAQMQGGGGGMSVLGGQTLLQGSSSYYNGQLTVSVAGSGSIRTDGSGSTGIVAQASLGNPNGGTTGIDVEVYGSVQGGSGSGKGVWVDGGLHNAVNVYPGGSVTALSGQAICCGALAVGNQALIVGTIDTTGTVTNAATGTWTLPAAMTSTAANVVNSGTLVIAGEGQVGNATLVGNLTQTASGTLVIDVDFNSRQADRLTVHGDAALAGRVEPVYGSVLPGIALPVLSVDGEVSGTLTAAPSALFGFGLDRAGQQFLLSAASADFAPAAFGLKPSRKAVAGHLQSIWDRGGTPTFGTLFGLLGHTADASPSAYAAQLRQLSPDATFAPGALGGATAHNVATKALSCPGFEGATAVLVEGQCSWGRVSGATTEQSSDNGVTDFSIDSTTWQLGGQAELAPGWFAGGSLAYAQDRLSSHDDLSKGDGESGYGALTLKRQTGPWLFAAAAFGGAGRFDTRRTITLPGFEAVAKGDPDTSSAGLLLRAAYTLGQEAFYWRPSIDLSAIHVRTGGYREQGAGALDLEVESASQTTWALTPTLEIGGRVALGGERVLRPYLSVGASLKSNDAWHQTARLTGAPAGAERFTTSVPTDRVVGRVGAGVQLFTRGALDLRLQYDGEFSESRTSHGGSLIASLRF